MESETVTLIIENQPLVCNKSLLMTNSDYFRVLFSGPWEESSSSSVTLEETNREGFSILVTKLSDDGYNIEEEHLLPVLETARKYQFTTILDQCIYTLTQGLNPTNCLNIWIFTEALSIKPLYLQAKCMAFDEFLTIKRNSTFEQLDLDCVCKYLGHIDLRTDCERSVFNAAMEWWEKNKNNLQPSTTFPKLLRCVDFSSIAQDELRELIATCVTRNYDLVCDILNCYLQIKDGRAPVEAYAEDVIREARILLRSRKRKPLHYPCLLVEVHTSETKGSKTKTVRGERNVVYYDEKKGIFQKLVNIEDAKIKQLEGYKLQAHKQFIFMVGGEYHIGQGNWNFNLWVYDTIKHQWAQKAGLPQPRRHFEIVIIYDYVYIIGGTGRYRVIQQNLLHYDFATDTWSDTFPFPSQFNQMKCCNFLEKPFIMDFDNKLAYKFNEAGSEYEQFQHVDIREADRVMSMEPPVAVFTRNNNVFVKGKNLFELKPVSDHLELVNETEIHEQPVVCERMDTVLCGNIIYSLSKFRRDDNHHRYTLETYNMDTHELGYIFRDQSNQVGLEIDGVKYGIDTSVKIFAYHHPDVVEDNQFIIDPLTLNE